MTVKIKGVDSDGNTLWLNDGGFWTPEKDSAAKYSEQYAKKFAREQHARNWTLDRDERILVSLEK